MVKNTLPIIFFLITGLYWTYLAYTETFYRLGIILIPVVFVFAILFGSIAYFKYNRSFKHGIRTFSISAIILLSGLIIWHKIEHYKPTLTVRIPENFEGTVYLFPSDTLVGSTIDVNANGIGYGPHTGQFHYKYKHGSKRIDDVQNTINSNQITYWSADSTKIRTIAISCFDVEKDKVYPKTELSWVYKECMSKSIFEHLIKQGLIKKDTLYFRNLTISTN